MDSGKEYTEARLKEAGVRPLTDELKKELSDKRAEFIKSKGELEKIIGHHEAEIKKAREKIEDLEIPSTPGAKYLHDRGNGIGLICGLRTAIFYGRDGDMTDSEYLCLYCNALFYAESSPFKR